HGFRALLATGRSLDEVRERCRAYGLAGGVAEYGGATYDHATGRVAVLLSPQEAAVLEALRESLGRLTHVVVDSGHRYSIRAYLRHPNGKRSGIPSEHVETVIEDLDVRAIPGELQTDFQVRRLDKSVGLRAAVEMLGGPLIFAVGDAAADPTMLQAAESSYAPAGSDPSLRSVA